LLLSIYRVRLASFIHYSSITIAFTKTYCNNIIYYLAGNVYYNMICEYACRESHSDLFRSNRVALEPVQHRSDYMNDFPNSYISCSLLTIYVLQVVLFSIFNFVYHTYLNFHKKYRQNNVILNSYLK